MRKTIDLSEILSNDYKFYAHKKDDKLETLQEHSELTLKYFDKIKDNKIKDVFTNIENELFSNKESKDLFNELLTNIFYLHDIGKVNPVFQKSKMDNDIGISIGLKNYSNHSILSSYMYINIFLNILKEEYKKII